MLCGIEFVCRFIRKGATLSRKERRFLSANNLLSGGYDMMAYASASGCVMFIPCEEEHPVPKLVKRLSNDNQDKSSSSDMQEENKD